MNDRTAINKIEYHNLKNMKYPTHIQIDPCGICNQSCIWCFYHGGYDDKQKVDRIEDIRNKWIKTEPLLKFLDSCRNIVRAVTLVGGGEPLIHPDIEKILKKIVGCGFKFGVITNLSMKLPYEVTQLLRMADWIRVSLDAGTANTYWKLHQPNDADAYSNVMNNIAKLNNYTTIGLSFLVHEQNRHEIEDFYNLAKKKLIKGYLQFKPVYDESQGFNYTEEEITKIDKRINLLPKFKQVEIIGGLKKRIETLKWKPEEYALCRITDYRIQLGADGYLYPCCMYKYVKEYRYGSIYNKKGYIFTNIMSSVQRAKVDYKLKIEKCPPCWDKPIQPTIFNEKLEMIDRTGNEVDLEFV